MKTMVELSHSFLEPVLHRQAVLLDGTLGRGQDAAFLLKRAWKVHAFEIQAEIARQTEQRIGDARLQVHVCSHDRIAEVVKEPLDGAIFNFGWCPGSDRQIRTEEASSLRAVQQVVALLKPKGRIALVFYPHMEGEAEGQVILEWFQRQNHRHLPCQVVRMANCEGSPWCLLAEKRKEWHGAIS